MPAYLASFHFMVLRGVVGVLIGVLYGLLVGVLVYPLFHIGLDYEHPGPLIPNTVEFADFATELAAFFTGSIGAIVGLIVGLLGASKSTAAKIGLAAGFLVIVLISISFPPRFSTLRDVIDLGVALLLLPVGLAIVSLLVASVVNRFKLKL